MTKPYLYPLLIALLFSVSGTAACEKRRTEILGDEPAPVAIGAPWGQDTEDAAALSDRAHAAQQAGEFARCASDFVQAAKQGPKTDAGERLHRAATCAARGGDYRSSLFHMYSAAAAGYDDVDEVRADPWLRPLHSTSRWPLVMDELLANQRARKTAPEKPTLCALLQAHFGS